MKRGLALLGLAAGLASGCGGQAGHGQATLWVTRDRGAHVLLVAKVPAGLTAIQALERKAEVKTRYGGRFVQAIDGVEGSLASQRDWFYFVNGYEADRGAAEYRLHSGDVEWWDYRAWRGASRVPVVVGAFPEPFLHGYGGKRLPAAVVYVRDRRAAREAARLIGAGSVTRAGAPVRPGTNVLYLAPRAAKTRFEASLREPSGPAGGAVRMLFVGNVRDLVSRRFRYRYEVGP